MSNPKEFFSIDYEESLLNSNQNLVQQQLFQSQNLINQLPTIISAGKITQNQTLVQNSIPIQQTDQQQISFNRQPFPNQFISQFNCLQIDRNQEFLSSNLSDTVEYLNKINELNAQLEANGKASIQIQKYYIDQLETANQEKDNLRKVNFEKNEEINLLKRKIGNLHRNCSEEMANQLRTQKAQIRDLKENIQVLQTKLNSYKQKMEKDKSLLQKQQTEEIKNDSIIQEQLTLFQGEDSEMEKQQENFNPPISQQLKKQFHSLGQKFELEDQKTNLIQKFEQTKTPQMDLINAQNEDRIKALDLLVINLKNEIESKDRLIVDQQKQLEAKDIELNKFMNQKKNLQNFFQKTSKITQRKQPKLERKRSGVSVFEQSPISQK